MADVLPMRRLGSGVTHLVAIRHEDLSTLKWIGPPFRGTDALVVSLCLAKLNGTKVWMQNGTVCRGCERWSTRQGHEVRFCDPAVDIASGVAS